MMAISRLILVSLTVAVAAPACANTVTLTHDKSFEKWVKEFRIEAMAEGIDEKLLDDAFLGVEPSSRIVALDRKQPESQLTMEQYLDKVLSQQRISKAQTLYRENREILNRIGDEYGVQPEYIVSLWGIESNFGERMGSFNVIEALATLAYDGRRSDFFRKELLNALKIVQARHTDLDDMEGSWAGAMGQCQFMPSSFLRYAVDYNGDGRKDIWHTKEDVFASIANYLSSEGWDGTKGWGSRNNPGDNFEVILKWNRSRYFATAVGTLAYQVKN